MSLLTLSPFHLTTAIPITIDQLLFTLRRCLRLTISPKNPILTPYEIIITNTVTTSYIKNSSSYDDGMLWVGDGWENAG